MPSRILLIHGFSETSLDTYSELPTILSQDGYTVENIVLSGYNSLDDNVSIDDLALALEEHAQDLEAQGWDFSDAGLICHSTGAIIARRWILNRRQNAKPGVIPSHLITMAGANHGSTLAQVGKSVIVYLMRLLEKHEFGVGAGVLTDLDYGSDFLLRLNHDWLSAGNAGLLDGLFGFSMSGDFIGNDAAVKLFWQSSEAGSDNTVRLSAANLNYRFLVADPDAGTIDFLQPSRNVPHLIVHNKSHFGTDTGILASIKDTADPAYVALKQALGVKTADDYAKVQTSWDAVTQAWLNDPQNAANVNATLVFSVSDRAGHAVDDCFIGFLDQQTAGTNTLQALQTSSDAIEPHSPIHNTVERGSYSFYLNWPKYRTVNHLVHIEATSATPLISYKPVDYKPSADVAKMIQPNEFTYVVIKMDRDAYGAYALYQYSPALDVTDTWMPFPPGSIPRKP